NIPARGAFLCCLLNLGRFSSKDCPGFLFLGFFVFNIPITIRKHFENTWPVDCIQQRPKGIFEIYIYTGGIQNGCNGNQEPDTD
ncbi:MAG: hypothetical protein ACLRH1_11610, partial [Acutalibacteraceae bacterium]